MKKYAICLICFILTVSSLSPCASQTQTASSDDLVKQFLEKKKLTFTDKGQTKKLSDYLAIAEEKCVFTFQDASKTYKAQLSVTCKSDRLPIKAFLSTDEKTVLILAIDPKEVRKETKSIELTFSPPAGFQPESGYRLFLFRKESKNQDSDYLYTELPVTFFSSTYKPGQLPEDNAGTHRDATPELSTDEKIDQPNQTPSGEKHTQSDTAAVSSDALQQLLYTIKVEINDTPVANERIRLGSIDDTLTVTYVLPPTIADNHPVRLALETSLLRQFLDIPLAHAKEKPIVVQTPEAASFYLRLYYEKDESIARQIAVILAESPSLWAILGYTALSFGAILLFFYSCYYYLPDFTKKYLPPIGQFNVLSRIGQGESDIAKLRAAHRDLSSQVINHEKILKRILTLPTIREELSGGGTESPRSLTKPQRVPSKNESHGEETSFSSAEKNQPDAKNKKYSDLFSPFTSSKPPASVMNSSSFFMQSVADYLNERIAGVEQWNNSAKNDFVDSLEEKYATRVYHLEPPSASGQSHQGSQETIALEQTSGFANFMGFLAKERFVFFPVPWIDLYDPKKRTRVRNFFSLQEEDSTQTLTFYSLPELTLLSSPDESEWTVRRTKPGALALPSFAKFLDQLPQ